MSDRDVSIVSKSRTNSESRSVTKLVGEAPTSTIVNYTCEDTEMFFDICNMFCKEKNSTKYLVFKLQNGPVVEHIPNGVDISDYQKFTKARKIQNLEKSILQGMLKDMSKVIGNLWDITIDDTVGNISSSPELSTALNLTTFLYQRYFNKQDYCCIVIREINLLDHMTLEVIRGLVYLLTAKKKNWNLIINKTVISSWTKQDISDFFGKCSQIKELEVEKLDSSETNALATIIENKDELKKLSVRADLLSLMSDSKLRKKYVKKILSNIKKPFLFNALTALEISPVPLRTTEIEEITGYDDFYALSLELNACVEQQVVISSVRNNESFFELSPIFVDDIKESVPNDVNVQYLERLFKSNIIKNSNDYVRLAEIAKLTGQDSEAFGYCMMATSSKFRGVQVIDSSKIQQIIKSLSDPIFAEFFSTYTSCLELYNRSQYDEAFDKLFELLKKNKVLHEESIHIGLLTVQTVAEFIVFLNICCARRLRVITGQREQMVSVAKKKMIAFNDIPNEERIRLEEIVFETLDGADSLELFDKINSELKNIIREMDVS